MQSYMLASMSLQEQRRREKGGVSKDREGSKAGGGHAVLHTRVHEPAWAEKEKGVRLREGWRGKVHEQEQHLWKEKRKAKP
jgi:hypothetical protein